METIISATISDFVANIGFMHKRQKNNPPEISWSFFYADEFKIYSFEEQNLASAIYNYFGIFDIIKSQYHYKIYIDKKDEYVLAIKVQYKEKEYLLNQSLIVLNKMEILKFISFLNRYLIDTPKLLKSVTITLSNPTREILLELPPLYPMTIL